MSKFAKDDEKYFDVTPDQSFLDAHGEFMSLLDDHPIARFFNRQNTKEFYIGFIAGIRCAQTLQMNLPPELLKDELIGASLIATLIAKSKS